MFKNIIAGLLITLITTSAFAGVKKYKLLGDPPAGSKFRSVDAVALIPFNKEYEQLTPAQQKIFRDSYGGLAETEKPPFPVNGTQSIYRPIVKGHKEVARAGKLFLIAMIDKNGKVETVQVYDSPADSMTQYATTVLFNTEFTPATCAGQPCKMEFPFEFDLPAVKKSRSTRNSILGN